jgi:hypothetical protein
MLRYDTATQFSDSQSWMRFSVTPMGSAVAFGGGAVFDGRYVLSPGVEGAVLQYDTRESFETRASWSIFMRLPESATGSAFDGQFEYVLPQVSSNGATVLRHVASSKVDVPNSWSSFNLGDIGALGGLDATTLGAFDGRYVYLISCGARARYGVIRYDTNQDFLAAVSWEGVEDASIGLKDTCFLGGVFDGEYLYVYSLAGAAVARFHARTLPALPPLPGFHGSFF